MKRFITASVLFILFLTLVLPAVSQAGEQHMGNTDLPDTRLFYSIDDVYKIAETLGETGRSYYVRQRITFDLVWPMVYSWFFYTAIMLLFQMFQPKSISNTLRWFPVFAFIFDYLENGLASLVILTYPEKLETLARLLPFTTLLKWCFIGLSLMSLVGGLLFLFIRYSRKREKEKWAKENQE